MRSRHSKSGTLINYTFLAVILWLIAAKSVLAAEVSDPTLDLLVKKGIITQEEATKAKAEAEAMRTNMMAMPSESKWKIGNAIKNVELFGDLRLRFEDRVAKTPSDGKLELYRGRVAVRLGLRGEAFDDFYYG